MFLRLFWRAPSTMRSCEAGCEESRFSNGGAPSKSKTGYGIKSMTGVQCEELLAVPPHESDSV